MDSFNPNMQLPQHSNQTTLGKELVQYLTLVDGDAASTNYQIYQSKHPYQIVLQILDVPPAEIAFV